MSFHFPRSVRATREEKARRLPGDERIPQAIDTLTHGVTIRGAPRDVWPWLVQMGAGTRAGFFPALPGATEGFTLLAIEPERVLTLGWVSPDGTLNTTWTFVLDEVAPGVTRLVVRARGVPGYRFYGLPSSLTRLVVRIAHFIMQRKQLLGIARRAERTTPRASAFKALEGEAAFLAAYDVAMTQWPVPYEELEISTRFGTTRVVASGPKDGPPLVLLHGYMATSAMWAPNIADFARDHRVYAIEVMGQPGRSIPGDPIGNVADYVSWLTATLDGLHLHRVALVGMPFGGTRPPFHHIRYPMSVGLRRKVVTSIPLRPATCVTVRISIMRNTWRLATRGRVHWRMPSLSCSG